MNTFRILLLIGFIYPTMQMQGQTVANFTKPEMLLSTISLDTSSDLLSLETLARRTPINELSPDRLTARVQATSVPYKKLPLRYDAREDILPSIRNYFGNPVILFDIGNQFESMYRVNNLAFFEANRNTVMSRQYFNGACVTPL
jgi:hypothetical protein